MSNAADSRASEPSDTWRDQRSRRVGPRATYWWLLGGAVAALGSVLLVALLAGARPYLVLGASDPGSLVAIATPVVRLSADVTAAACLGSLAFGVCFTRPQSSGLVSPLAYRELRFAMSTATAWAVGALLMVP